jgi:NhaP-type Na+/H+ or K+/H+ antiporter
MELFRHRWLPLCIALIVYSSASLPDDVRDAEASSFAMLGFTKSSSAVTSITEFQVEECKEYEYSDHLICIRLRFPDVHNSSESKKAACRAFPHKEDQHEPKFWDFLSVPTIDCAIDKACFYNIQQSSVVARTSYDVFCILYEHGLAGAQSAIEPKCNPKADSCGLQVSTGEMFNKDLFGAVDLLGVLLLVMYIVWSYFFQYASSDSSNVPREDGSNVPREDDSNMPTDNGSTVPTENSHHCHCSCVIHETGFVVIVGLSAGFLMKVMYGKAIQFNYDIMCYFLLPSVIFAAGFNMKKRNFFRYFGYIAGLGVACTVMTFALIFYGSSFFTFRNFRGDVLTLEPQRRLLMAAVLSSTDSVAAMAFVSSETLPGLYAVIFGEGVLNDVVSILLSKSIEGLSSLPSFMQLLGNLAFFFTTSLSLGLVFSFGASFIFKHAAVLHDESIKPVLLVILINYTCYILADLCEISSIFALFVCALCCRHYLWYSLSEKAKEFSCEVSEFLSFTSEAFVFGYFGLCAPAYLDNPRSFSLSLIFSFVAIICIARFLAVFLMVAVFYELRQMCFPGERLSLDMSQWCLVAFAGCMRGTIAYALILHALPPADRQNWDQTILVSTVLGVVVINSLVFGFLFPIIFKLLGIKPEIQDRSISASSNQTEVSMRDWNLNSTWSTQRIREGMHFRWVNFDHNWLIPVFRRNVVNSHGQRTARVDPVTESRVERSPSL